jgi:hypothetical protein
MLTLSSLRRNFAAMEAVVPPQMTCLPSLEKYLGFNALHRCLLLIQNSYKMVVLTSSIFWLIESALDEVPIFKGFEFCKLLKAS